jgi:hypothetical protein
MIRSTITFHSGATSITEHATREAALGYAADERAALAYAIRSIVVDGVLL